jgi:rubrerythrin
MSLPQASTSDPSTTPLDPSTLPLDYHGESHLPLGTTRKRAAVSDRALFKVLRSKGMVTQEEHYMTMAQSLNPVISRSKPDKLGVITKRAITSLENTVASRVAKRFSELAGGNRAVADHLEALGEKAPKEVQAVARALKLKHNAKKPLAEVIANCGASLLTVMRHYANGAVALAHTEAVIEMHQQLPAVVRDVMRHALDQPGICQQCSGAGKFRRRSIDKKATLPCPICKGTGTGLVASPHKEWAAKAVLNATNITKPASEVNVAVGVNIQAGKGYAERMLDMADRTLYGKDEVVDAEVVPPAELPGGE